jgi:hypothetical protein
MSTHSTLSREEFDAVVRELKDALKIQFERIAQMQAELDVLRMASERRSSRKKSAPAPAAIAADNR